MRWPSMVCSTAAGPGWPTSALPASLARLAPLPASSAWTGMVQRLTSIAAIKGLRNMMAFVNWDEFMVPLPWVIKKTQDCTEFMYHSLNLSIDRKAAATLADQIFLGLRGAI